MRKLSSMLLIIILATETFASLPNIKTYSKQKDLINGKAENISISSDGILSLSPQVKKIFESNKPFIWDLAVDSKANIFIATGDGAKILRIKTNGKIDSIAQWSDSEVYALAIDNNGVLYAAVSPGGKIYRFSKTQKPELFVELKVKYIWDLVFDTKNNCYAATGDSGVIYKITEAGKPAIFFQSDETHLRCLCWDSENNLLTGSYKNGYIYRIDPSGKGTVVYDSNFDEISQIQIQSDGTIYAVAMNSADKITPSAKSRNRSLEKISSLKAEDLITISAPSDKRKTGSVSGILQIQPNGVVKNLWNEINETVHSISLTKGGILAGSGEKGRLYEISEDGERTLLLTFTEAQIVNLLQQPSGEIWLGTANLAAAYKLINNFEKSASYLSPIIDATSKTRWGTIQWEEKMDSGDKAQFYTRTGNTKEPNSAWNPWKKVVGGKENGFIKSAEARFLQWKLELKTNKLQTSPEICQIRVSYLRQNLPPQIKSITIHPIQRKKSVGRSTTIPPTYSASRGSAKTSIETQLPLATIRREAYRRTLTNGYRRVSWRAKDENNDQLNYALFFRFKNENNWLLLKKDLTRANFTWDSRSMPDGYYRLKLIASDERSNPVNTAQTAEKISDWFVIDNSAPAIKNLSLKKVGADSVQVFFTVCDKLSAIKKVEFSLNAQKWQWVYPTDLVCDTKEEKFNFRIKIAEDGYRIIVVKATDEAENTGFGRILVKG